MNASPEPRDPTSFFAAAAALNTINEAVRTAQTPRPERTRRTDKPVRTRPWPHSSCCVNCATNSPDGNLD